VIEGNGKIRTEYLAQDFVLQKKMSQSHQPGVRGDLSLPATLPVEGANKLVHVIVSVVCCVRCQTEVEGKDELRCRQETARARTSVQCKEIGENGVISVGVVLHVVWECKHVKDSVTTQKRFMASLIWFVCYQTRKEREEKLINK